MEELIALGVILGVLGVACLIGWGAGVLIDVYWKYRVKKNRINHPKLVELQKEREKLCEEYNQWWNEKYGAQSRIVKYMEQIKYYDNQTRKDYYSIIERERENYTNADKHMEELLPLINTAREAEQTYREEHNIRHW